MIREYIDAFSPVARANGIGQMRFYVEEVASRAVSVYQGKQEHIEQSEECRLFVEGEVDGFSGGAFVGDLRPSRCAETIRQIKESAQESRRSFVPFSLPELPDLDGGPPLRLPLEELTKRLAAAERAAYDADGRITLVHSCAFEEYWGRVTLSDGTGRQVSDGFSGGRFHIGLTAQEGGQIQMGERSLPLAGGQYPDMERLARQAAQDAAGMLDTTSYPTMHSPVVLDSRVACQLLDAFLPAFFAKNILNHTSVLEGKLGQRIAGELTVLEEDPLLSDGLCRRRFDDEGTPTSAKEILSGGILRTYLCDRRSAAQCGLPPGGNGFRPSFTEEPAPGYTNLILRTGEKSQEELLADMGCGLLIREVSGVFAGANPASGDFSLIARGCQVRDGRLCGGVNQITIAGNFFQMLRQARGVGNDGAWMRTSAGCLRAPSLYVESLAISGDTLV